jgi:uncharacterized protein DUF4235
VKVLYKPIGVVFGILGGLLAKNIFQWIWSKFDDEEPPKPTTKEVPTPKVMAAAALEGVTFKLTRAAVDRAGARTFEHLTGIWPGPKAPEPD